MVISDITSYIDHLCRLHKSIQHSDTDCHFISEGTLKAVAMDSIVRYPLVVLTRDGYTYNGEDADYQKNKSVTLLIVDHVTDNADSIQIQSCYERCELVGDQFMRRMVRDKRSRLYSFLTMFNPAGVEGSYIENQDDSLYGVALTLDMGDKFRQSECSDPFNSEEVTG